MSNNYQIISNNVLTVRINLKGAEIDSIFNAQTNLEYMWEGDPTFWGKKSPILFPIVGGLKDNKYIYENSTYQLSRHGFARDQVFTFDEKLSTSTAAYFFIKSNNETKSIYPFDFKFVIKYEIFDNRLEVTYIVENSSNEKPILFSVGAHPAFRVPLTTETNYNDWFLEFNKIENLATWPLTSSGLVESTSLPLINNSNILPLTKELFYNDALILKNLVSDELVIKSNLSTNGIKIIFSGFPFLGIWAAKDANFVCIEPWQGIADSVASNNNLSDKEGIITLGPNQTHQATWIGIFF